MAYAKNRVNMYREIYYLSQAILPVFNFEKHYFKSEILDFEPSDFQVSSSDILESLNDSPRVEISLKPTNMI